MRKAVKALDGLLSIPFWLLGIAAAFTYYSFMMGWQMYVRWVSWFNGE